MKKNKQIILSEKKFKKELKRKRTSKEKKKLKLTNWQVNIALQNIELLESKRREALQKFLDENNFKLAWLEDLEHKWKAQYIKDDIRYILEKVNLSDNISSTLEQDLQRFSWLYQIVDIETKKKWFIFQINFLEKEKEFKVIKLLDSETIDWNKFNNKE